MWGRGDPTVEFRITVFGSASNMLRTWGVPSCVSCIGELFHIMSDCMWPILTVLAVFENTLEGYKVDLLCYSGWPSPPTISTTSSSSWAEMLYPFSTNTPAPCFSLLGLTAIVLLPKDLTASDAWDEVKSYEMCPSVTEIVHLASRFHRSSMLCVCKMCQNLLSFEGWIILYNLWIDGW